MQLNEMERRIARCAEFQRVFQTPDGQKVYSELKQRAGFNSDPFSPDPYTTAYNCGMIAIIKFIDNILNEDIKKWSNELKKQKTLLKETENA